MALDTRLIEEITHALSEGSVVPVLGPYALRGAVAASDGRPMPADGDSLIATLTGGRPLPPKVAYEYSRAAMHFELKKGRNFVNRTLTEVYGQTEWTRAPLHDWLAGFKPRYVIDLNRDTQLQATYADTPHTLVVGLSRIGGTDYRFKIYQFEAGAYRTITQEEANPELPVIFKPLGTPSPEPNYVASDADFVDYMTELMGGFAIPSFLKQLRKGKRYLFLGLPLTRDTERMVMHEVLYGHAEPGGWAFLPAPKKNEMRFCDQHQLTLIDADYEELLGLASPARVANG